MSRVAILDMFIGFLCIFLSACGGAFLSQDVSQAFISDPEWLNSWNLTLLKSAHNHFNQFGYLLVFFGLTLPYSRIKKSWHLWQSAGLWLGALAMGPGMIIKAYEPPSTQETLLSYMLGLLISIALLSLATHITGLLVKWMRAV